jgi:transcription initiation factor IIE alpha subunit
MAHNDVYIEEILNEVSKVRQLLELIAREKLKEEIEKIVATQERRRIWKVCKKGGGSLSTKELAERSRVSQRSVQRLIKELHEANLVEIAKKDIQNVNLNMCHLSEN